MASRIPVVSYLVLDDDGSAHLQAQRCMSCGAHYVDRRNACGRCGGRTFEPHRLADRGVVRSFTIVHRAPPMVRTPFVSAVVDLDGGGRVKANLLVEPDPDGIELGMAVTLSTFTAGSDAAGTEAVAFGFRPHEMEAV